MKKGVGIVWRELGEKGVIDNTQATVMKDGARDYKKDTK